MTDTLAHAWLIRQQRLGHALCLVLDSENEHPARQALLKNSRPDQYCSLYSQTPVADLADAGPFVFLFDNPNDSNVSELISRPERHWGWLTSLPKDGLPMLVEHWRERLLIGGRPHQALYRFHDNRVLARAIDHITVEALPAYLGPSISVCYWQGSQWECKDNPAPGAWPVPDSPLWLQLPASRAQTLETRLTNARRFLLAEHVEAFATLAEQQDPHDWLRSILHQAESWDWHAPGQLEFLLTQSLQAPAQTFTPQWQPRQEESPDEHFERVRLLAKFWQQDDAP